MSDTVWYAAVVELEACEDGVIPLTHGQQIHGLFLELVRCVAPQIASTLHNSGGRQPFTVSPLEKLPPSHGDGHPIRAGSRTAVRFTLLNSEVFSGFVASLVGEGRAQQLRIGRVPFVVRRVATTPAEHPRAGTTQPRLVLATAPDSHTIGLHFLTPTAFSLGTRAGAGKIAEPLPRPDLVFGGLLSAWNAFSGVPLSPELRQVAAERIVISRFRLHSAAHRFRDHLQIGSVGQCTYTVKGNVPPEALRAFNALAAATEYLGVGYRTTMGMGQARLVTPGERND